MSGQRTKFEKIPIWSEVLGIVLLLGLLSMGYGIYENSELALHAGLAVTMLGALDGIVFFVISPGGAEVPETRATRGARGGE